MTFLGLRRALCLLGPLAFGSVPAATFAVPSAAIAGVAKKKPAHKPPVRTRGKKTAKRRVFLELKVPALRGSLPNLQSLGALVTDLDSGEELFSRKPDQARPIASISKLLAMLVIADHNLELEGLTTIKKIDAEVARGGATSRLHEGMTLSNRDLLHAALLGSDNRAVSALGRAVGLQSSQLATAMTRKATELGFKQTRFREPTGLSIENVSTPRETLSMLRVVIKHPLLGPVVQRAEYDAHPVARPSLKYVNTHRPAARASVQVLGGKTGYNDGARYCLTLVARINGRTIGMALLGTEGKLTRFGDVARMADWIMARKSRTTAPLAGVPPITLVPLAPANPPHDAGQPPDSGSAVTAP